MKKTRKRQKRERVNATEMAAEIRKELRGILRRMDELRRPLPVELIEGIPEGEPRYLVRRASDYESIQEDVITLAGMVWHLKDRLKRWMAASGLEISPSIEELAAGCKALLICGDLIDSKKHGGGSNSSGHAPRVGGISFQPGGMMALRYDGALKAGEFLVTNPEPIPYTIEIVAGDGQGTFGPAIEVICQAFEQWRMVIVNADLLGGSDAESVQLRRLLKRFEKGESPIFHSELVG
jgi:hypothetical protein